LYFYFGSNFPELINGTVEGDGLYGNGGNDTIFGQQANDTIDGGAGNDIIDGGTGDDSIVGGNGSDTLVGGNGADFMLGSDGNDVLLGDEDSDTLTGGTGDDYLSGDNGSDVLLSGGGADTIDGGAGSDTLDGSGSSLVSLLGGTGDDLLLLDTEALEQAGTTAEGGDDNDTLILRDNGSSNPVLEVGLDLVGKLSGIEQIDATGANVVVDFGNSTAADIRSILGLSGPTGSGTLTLDFDGNDQFSVASGEFFTQVANLTTFYSDAGLTNEIARVSVI
jgi:large repetitive protein